MTKLRLNLGSGGNPKQGWVNVDKYGSPDVVHDLEEFPWPWDDDAAQEVTLNHVLEHLGADTKTYLKIIQELYRVSAAGCRIQIAVPHPRHDEFLGDPTHVRPITAESLALFSQTNNREWIEKNYANSPLGLYLDVDFEIRELNYTLDPAWLEKIQSGDMNEAQVFQAMRQYNNVAKEIRIVLEVVKVPTARQ